MIDSTKTRNEGIAKVEIYNLVEDEHGNVYLITSIRNNDIVGGRCLYSLSDLVVGNYVAFSPAETRGLKYYKGRITLTQS